MNLLRLAPLLVLTALFSVTTPLLIAPTHPDQVDSSTSIYPPPDSGGNLLFGQKHAYTIVFRNDGAATVLGRIVFKNTEKEPVSSLALTIPQEDIADAAFYQAFAQPQCIEYRPLPAEGTSPECLEQSVDYLYTNFEYFGNEEYTKLSAGQEGQTFTLPLATAIAEQEAGAIVFAFRSRSYTSSIWSGSYNFIFTTPTVAVPISLVRVAVGVDSDLYLKGRQAKVAYKEQAAAPQDLAASSIGRAIDFYQQQGFTKEGRNLGSNESLVVKGTYADSWWKLYPWQILITIAGILILGLCWILWHRYYHPAKQFAGPFTGIFTPKNVGIAFLSSLTVFAITYVTQFVINQYRYGDPVSSSLLNLVIVGAYMAALFGPAVWTGFAKGWKHALFIVLAELLFLAIILAIYVNVVPSPGGIVPLPAYLE